MRNKPMGEKNQAKVVMILSGIALCLGIFNFQIGMIPLVIVMGLFFTYSIIVIVTHKDSDFLEILTEKDLNGIAKANCYACPKCNLFSSEKSLVGKTESKFRSEPDPHYFWKEKHKCPRCKTIYKFKNAT